jgi:hypothetical protein
MRVRVECRHRQSFSTTRLGRGIKREGGDTWGKRIIANATLFRISTSLLLDELVKDLKDIVDFAKLSCAGTIICVEITLQCKVYHFSIVLNTRKTTGNAETILVKFKNFSERHVLGTGDEQQSMAVLVPTEREVSVDTFHYKKLEFDYSKQKGAGSFGIELLRIQPHPPLTINVTFRELEGLN